MSPLSREEHRRQVEEARRLAQEHLVPVAARGTPGRVNRELLEALSHYGLLPRLFPERVGGTSPHEATAVDVCVLREALAQVSIEAETALAMQGIGGYPILQSGTDDVVRRWLPAIATGRAVAAFALTEPEHGSDAAALELRADPDGDGYRLTGVKTWISNAPDADVYTIFARTTADVRAKGVTAFVLPGDTPGLTGTPIELISEHPIGRLELDGAYVPRDHVLGEVDAGFRVAMGTLDLFRPSVGAFAVGMAQAALDVAVEHAATRAAFGRPIREFQAVSHRVAEMATRTEAARLMVYAAAGAHDDGAPDVTVASAMAKLYATEVAQFVIDGAVQVVGAAALERGHVLEHLYREVRAPRIYEGTSEIQREIIARELFRER